MRFSIFILWLCMCCSILAAAEASTFSLSSLWRYRFNDQSPPPPSPPPPPTTQVLNVLPRWCWRVENPCARDPDSREYIKCCVPIGLCKDAVLACQEPTDSDVYKQCCHDQKATPPASQPAVVLQLDQSPAPAPAPSPEAFDIETPPAPSAADALDIESPPATAPSDHDASDIESPVEPGAPSPDALQYQTSPSSSAPAPTPTTPPQCQQKPAPSFTLGPRTCWEERISNITCMPVVGFIKTLGVIDVKHIGRSKRCCNVTTVITADCAVPIPNKSHMTTKKCTVYEIPSPPPPPGTFGSGSHPAPPSQSPSLAPALSPISDCSEHYAYEKKCDSKGRCCVRTEDYGVDCSTGVPRPYSHKHDECYTIGTK